MFNSLSPWHILVVGVVALLLFGNRLPEVARGLGRSINEFKRGLKEVSDDIEDDKPTERPRLSDDDPPKQVTKTDSERVVHESRERLEREPAERE
ncbi:MAG: twin-arginine translocase TatA/TatE family subunit [Planctomycetota bacterium]|nr:MAG: twin-arginine translocase TatA/TatE family subunit [Planctomycetota bacterium]